MMKESPNPLRAIHRNLHHFLFKRVRYTRFAIVVELSDDRPTLIVCVKSSVQIRPKCHPIYVLEVKQNRRSVHVSQAAKIEASTVITTAHQRSRSDVPMSWRIV